ncbi:hypothetical protein GUITHDRAFT_132293 [Guillardia theta CCMP2712]|uniref:PDZ domain-containing protein n=1 Tax=Guillardia theta (strain CCMP2712) TaxID=905079 RepID=L1K2J3_GUITC|nr:hypothetical protein GUITHDRAFT_132293 [Guillardia theta CCMP2712]EKX54598.1 hypothetical protein GUITHDRAFT_132293 [Guillardia theta CCMP2712]|eukprot:XP_005841578.1 hypothetical protein GUITHDRAFT_132293 [Guillardia theta CCMP2712]
MTSHPYKLFVQACNQDEEGLNMIFLSEYDFNDVFSLQDSGELSSPRYPVSINNKYVYYAKMSRDVEKGYVAMDFAQRKTMNLSFQDLIQVSPFMDSQGSAKVLDPILSLDAIMDYGSIRNEDTSFNLKTLNRTLRDLLCHQVLLPKQEIISHVQGHRLHLKVSKCETLLCESKISLCMSKHSRLGSQSALSLLPSTIIRSILDMAWREKDTFPVVTKNTTLCIYPSIRHEAIHEQFSPIVNRSNSGIILDDPHKLYTSQSSKSSIEREKSYIMSRSPDTFSKYFSSGERGTLAGLKSSRSEISETNLVGHDAYGVIDIEIVRRGKDLLLSVVNVDAGLTHQQLKVGDVVESVNGKSVINWIPRDVYPLLWGACGTFVTFGILRAGRRNFVTVERTPVKSSSALEDVAFANRKSTSNLDRSGDSYSHNFSSPNEISAEDQHKSKQMNNIPAGTPEAVFKEEREKEFRKQDSFDSSNKTDQNGGIYTEAILRAKMTQVEELNAKLSMEKAKNDDLLKRLKDAERQISDKDEEIRRLKQMVETLLSLGEQEAGLLNIQLKSENSELKDILQILKGIELTQYGSGTFCFCELNNLTYTQEMANSLAQNGKPRKTDGDLHVSSQNRHESESGLLFSLHQRASSKKWEDEKSAYRHESNHEHQFSNVSQHAKVGSLEVRREKSQLSDSIFAATQSLRCSSPELEELAESLSTTSSFKPPRNQHTWDEVISTIAKSRSYDSSAAWASYIHEEAKKRSSSRFSDFSMRSAGRTESSRVPSTQYSVRTFETSSLPEAVISDVEKLLKRGKAIGQIVKNHKLQAYNLNELQVENYISYLASLPGRKPRWLAYYRTRKSCSHANRQDLARMEDMQNSDCSPSIHDSAFESTSSLSDFMSDGSYDHNLTSEHADACKEMMCTEEQDTTNILINLDSKDPQYVQN